MNKGIFVAFIGSLHNDLFFHREIINNNIIIFNEKTVITQKEIVEERFKLEIEKVELFSKCEYSPLFYDEEIEYPPPKNSFVYFRTTKYPKSTWLLYPT